MKILPPLPLCPRHILRRGRAVPSCLTRDEECTDQPDRSYICLVVRGHVFSTDPPATETRKSSVIIADRRKERSYRISRRSGDSLFTWIEKFGKRYREKEKEKD